MKSKNTLEVRRKHVVLNGDIKSRKGLIEEKRYGAVVHYVIDMRYSKLSKTKDLEIKNRSGHILSIIDKKDLQTGLRSLEGVVSKEGYVKYRSKYSLR